MSVCVCFLINRDEGCVAEKTYATASKWSNAPMEKKTPQKKHLDMVLERPTS